MRLLARTRFAFPVHVISGDTANLTHTDELGNKTIVLSTPITKAMTLVEGAIWELEKGDEKLFGSDSGLVGAFLE